MRTISPSEFVRRLKHGIVSHESKIVWFLGAGCSVSSGVEDAGTLTERWLGELKYLETGDRDDLEDWAESRFPTYDRTDPAAAYIQVHEALFYTDQEQQREQDQLASGGQPGFGYATLAQLLTHEKWGDRCNTVITTNFDDLAADALYFYSQRKPQVLTHESFDRHVQVSDARPTIVKLYGDAHLGAEYLDGNRRLLRTDVKERLRALATECTLVFVGYGGRDDCILDLFEDMPKGAPSGGVFWVNDKAPGKSLEGWLEERRAVWAQNESFDSLMFLLRKEFELGHPSIDRFDQILQKYDEQYRSIAKSNAPAAPKAAPSDAQDAASAKAAVETSPTQDKTAPTDAETPSDLYVAATAEAPSYPVAKEALAKATAKPAADLPAESHEPLMTPTTGEPIIDAVVAMKAREKLDADAKAKAAPVAPNGADASPSAGQAVQPNDAKPPINGAVAPAASDIRVEAPVTNDPDIERVDIADFSTAIETVNPSDEVLELYDEATPGAETDAEPGSRDRIDALIAAAVKAMATDSETAQPVDMSNTAPSEDVAVPHDSLDAGVMPQPLPDRPRPAPTFSPDAELIDIVDGPAAEAGPLSPPTRLMQREDAVVLDARFRAALSEAPRDAMLLANYAQFLTVGRQDHDGAEHYFNRAIDADPQNDSALRMFARFLTDIRRDHERAEDCYRLAIRANFESAETMSDYAEFLWHARGDFETAGECFQVAVDAAPRDGRALTRYAKFLQDVQRNDDAAFALLKLAAASAERDPTPVVALAEFIADRRDDAEKAEATFERALEIGPDSPEALVAAAKFHATTKNDLTRAEMLLDQALTADPESIPALLAFADFLHAKRGDPKRAETMLVRAMEAAPGNARIALAYAKFRDEVLVDDEAAEDTYRKAINLDPRDATILAQYGRFLQFSRRKANAAEDRYRKAVSMEPRNPLALRSYGWFFVIERGNVEDGERFLRRAVSAAPSDGEALADLGEFLSKHSKNRGETDEMFRRAMAADKGNKRTMRRYARFLSDGKGDPNAAEALYRKVLDSEPKDARALGGSAHAMFVQGRTQEGIALLDQAFDAAMGDEPRRRSIDLLLELWFYRYAFDHASGRDAIKAAIWLVKEGAKVTRVELEPIVARALAGTHPEPDILRELARVVSGSTTPDHLERFNVA